ncbi:hypothetical protein ACQHIV_11340 [Kribbella sp. GL6]|uniref:hypothetical protein n=1 Tax=Kribbella sp. GL6 TaxID=3419765 RepID=UPI003CFD3798
MDSAVLVVTTMPLSKTARAELSEMLGPGYTVVDIRSAPDSANIVLTPVVSGNALGILRGMFPKARILYTELQDDERGISYAGPLARIVALEPDGYFVAHSLDALTPIVQTEAKLQLTGSTRRTPLTLSLDAAPPVPPESVGPMPQEDSAKAVPREPVDAVAGGSAPDVSQGSGPEVPQGAVAGAEVRPGTVRWVDRATAPEAVGRWLELEAIDALVVGLVGTDAPRRDILWPALVAECVIRLAESAAEDVLVDVGGLEPKIPAELQIRIESEQLDHAPWPE